MVKNNQQFVKKRFYYLNLILFCVWSKIQKKIVMFFPVLLYGITQGPTCWVGRTTQVWGMSPDMRRLQQVVAVLLVVVVTIKKYEI